MGARGQGSRVMEHRSAEKGQQPGMTRLKMDGRRQEWLS